MIPRERLGAAAKTFYDRDADELLWKLVDDPEHQGGSATWLLRAAAFAREEHPSFAHRQVARRRTSARTGPRRTSSSAPRWSA